MEHDFRVFTDANLFLQDGAHSAVLPLFSLQSAQDASRKADFQTPGHQDNFTSDCKREYLNALTVSVPVKGKKKVWGLPRVHSGLPEQWQVNWDQTSSAQMSPSHTM